MEGPRDPQSSSLTLRGLQNPPRAFKSHGCKGPNPRDCDASEPRRAPASIAALSSRRTRWRAGSRDGPTPTPALTPSPRSAPDWKEKDLHLPRILAHGPRGPTLGPAPTYGCGSSTSAGLSRLDRQTSGGSMNQMAFRSLAFVTLQIFPYF